MVYTYPQWANPTTVGAKVCPLRQNDPDNVMECPQLKRGYRSMGFQELYVFKYMSIILNS